MPGGPLFTESARPAIHVRADQWPVALCASKDIPVGMPPRGILVQVAGETPALEAILFRWQDRLIAYENQCRHWPVLLDHGDGDFLAPDRTHIQCRHHGALYEPLTGRCIAGPCLGARLRPLTVEEREGRIWLPKPTQPELEA